MQGRGGSVPIVFGVSLVISAPTLIPGHKVQSQLRISMCWLGTADSCLGSQGVAKT